MMKKAKTAALSFLLIFSLANAVMAQEPAPAPAPAGASVGGLTPEELNAPFRGSFFLTPLEIVAIQQALMGQPVNARVLSTPTSQQNIPAVRVIRVSGVVYHKPKDWIVWMNGQKVTPDNLLPEIVDIKVRETSDVHLKWYDVGLNKVIAITLRPQQTYDIVTGILLPVSQ